MDRPALDRPDNKEESCASAPVMADSAKPQIRKLGSLDGVEWQTLDPLQRVLLVTDGTVTAILEAAFLESIRVVKLTQEIVKATPSHALLQSSPTEAIVERRVLLRGVATGRNYVYAESLIAVNRMGPAFCRLLFDSNTPLGQLWLDQKLETYKEIVEMGGVVRGPGAEYLDCAGSGILIRKYRVYSGGVPVMIISEHFPRKFPPASESYEAR
jgi:chorismate-pyruvate lyase